ncbi:hypothetical protein P3465_23730, partial [Vibrio parahaemolyticus]|nr:hypothetical protein [Vibrio parahaemolyticus]
NGSEDGKLNGESQKEVVGGCGFSKSSTIQKIGSSIPGYSNPYVDVSLSKILNPKLLPMAVPLVCECVKKLSSR